MTDTCGDFNEAQISSPHTSRPAGNKQISARFTTSDAAFSFDAPGPPLAVLMMPRTARNHPVFARHLLLQSQFLSPSFGRAELARFGLCFGWLWAPWQLSYWLMSAHFLADMHHLPEWFRPQIDTVPESTLEAIKIMRWVCMSNPYYHAVFVQTCYTCTLYPLRYHGTPPQYLELYASTSTPDCSLVHLPLWKRRPLGHYLSPPPFPPLHLNLFPLTYFPLPFPCSPCPLLPVSGVDILYIF